MLIKLDDFRIDKLTELTEISDSSKIPEKNFSSSIFIVLTNKPRANECEFQLCSLMSFITKEIIMILINIARSRNTPKIGQEH